MVVNVFSEESLGQRACVNCRKSKMTQIAQGCKETYQLAKLNATAAGGKPSP
jgi:hypothetical protein